MADKKKKQPKDKLAADDLYKRIEMVTTHDGKEFQLPDDFEEYKKANPVGAAEYERQAKQLYVDTYIDPELDPNSPEFNIDKYNEAASKAKEAVSQLVAAYRAAVPESVITALEAVKNFGVTFQPQLDEVKKVLTEITTYMAQNAAGFQEMLAEYNELLPYLEEELKKKKYYGGCTLESFGQIEPKTEAEEEEKDRLWEEALAAAHEAKDKGALGSTTIKRAKNIEYPLDKPNSVIWNLLEKDTGGQISIAAEKRNSKKELNILYSIDFSELEATGIAISKRLTSFDKRAYIAISALFNAGNDTITLTQIYYAMGNTGRPSKTQLEKINGAVTKMMSAKITLDNKQEAETYKGYAKFVYDGSLLPLERATEIINGQLTDAALHIFREPPMISFAKQRKQITTLDVKLLQSPFNKTEANLLIDDYLLERIARAKKGNQPCKILFKTLYENAGITSKLQKSRAPEKIRGYLDYYKQCGHIKGYKEEKDGIIILL